MKTTRFLEFGVILATLYLTNEGDWRSPGRDRRCRGRNLERAALSRVKPTMSELGVVGRSLEMGVDFMEVEVILEVV